MIGLGWNNGYKTISILQIFLSAVLFVSLPLWKRKKTPSYEKTRKAAMTFSQILNLKGVKLVLTAFFAYCALETTAFLWASTYLVRQRALETEIAAKYAALFFIGITAGRFLSGLVSDKIGDRNMIRIGIGVMLTGIAAVWLPVTADWLCLNGLIVIGFGCAPIYPAIIHATPSNFGKENSSGVIGVQMASAYSGSTFIPPIFGLIAERINIGLFPAFLFAFAVLMLFMTEKLNKTMQKE
jgi:fucose permease